MNKLSAEFSELLGNDLNPVDKSRIVRMAEEVYGSKITILEEKITMLRRERNKRNQITSNY